MNLRFEIIARSKNPADQFRMFGFLSALLVITFIVNLADDYQQGQVQDMLWICHISMLLLAAGMYFQRPAYIQISTLWIIPGFLFWLVDGWFSGFTLTSALSHVLAIAAAYYAIRRVNVRLGLWIPALFYWLGLQLLSRWTTPPPANVNIAHHLRPEAEIIFDAYWQYWISTTLLAAFGLWLLEKLLHKRQAVVRQQRSKNS